MPGVWVQKAQQRHKDRNHRPPRVSPLTEVFAAHTHGAKGRCAVSVRATENLKDTHPRGDTALPPGCSAVGSVLPGLHGAGVSVAGGQTLALTRRPPGEILRNAV